MCLQLGALRATPVQKLNKNKTKTKQKQNKNTG
jgi:hypothetical protein